MRTKYITLEIKGVYFDVEYTYHPAEPEVRYDRNGTGDDGHSEYVEIEQITHCGDDFTDFLLDMIPDIERMILYKQRLGWL